MKSLKALLGFTFVLFLTTVGCRKKPAPDLNPTFSVLVNGSSRDYSIHVPAAANSKVLPVVLMLHGGGGNAEGTARSTLWDQLADKEGFLVVYPHGIGKEFKGKPMGTWNAGNCCGIALEKNINDVAFISALIDELAVRFNADRSRVYATGLSNGAQMSYRLACELSEKIAAIAPVAGNGVPCQAKPSRPVPIMHIHGELDPCILIKGGKCGGCFERFIRGLGIPATDRVFPCEGIESHLEYRAALYGCEIERKTTYLNGPAQCQSFECPANTEVSLCTLANGGHTFPGGTAGIEACETRPNGYICRLWKKTVGPVSSFDAKERIWDFFKRNRLSN